MKGSLQKTAGFFVLQKKFDFSPTFLQNSIDFFCNIWYNSLERAKCKKCVVFLRGLPNETGKENGMQPKYKRVLLKLSGEALAGDQRFGLNHEVIAPVVKQIVELHNMGVQVGLVIGGGNFWRGRQGTNMDRTTADQMGMLATVMNSLAMMDAIEQYGVPVRVQTALDMISLAEPFILRKALRHFEQGRIVIFACGTGNPYCSTDTAAALRACEIDADILLMAKNVDGIYDSDPKTNPDAKKYESLKYADIINRGLKVIDFTAATMCMENNVPTLAFGLNEENSIVRAVCGEQLGTLISV